MGKIFSEHEFITLHAGQTIKALERDFSNARELLLSADAILFSYPVYTFLSPSQLHRFIELIKENGVDLSGKYATQITTSKHFYDVTAHKYVEENAPTPISLMLSCRVISEIPVREKQYSPKDTSDFSSTEARPSQPAKAY